MHKKSWFAVIVSVFLMAANGRAAADLFDVSDYANSGSLKPFARDLGDLLGSATFHSGRPLGFSGFDMGVHEGFQLRPDPHDDILRRTSGTGPFGLPWVQAEIGLPFRLDGFIRGINYQGMTVAGGGLRYGIFKVSDQPWSPQILLASSAHSVSANDFSANHFSFNLVGSLNFPVFTPYIGAGIDRTRVTVLTIDQTRNSQNISLIGATATTLESRFTAGVTVRPYPFTYLQGAYTMAHGEPGFDMGLGVRF
jgi:hypothetical protein